MQAEAELRWEGDRIIRKVRGQVVRRLNQVGDAVVTQIQVNIGVPGPPASAPGEFPHRWTGVLQESVHYVVDARNLELTIVADAPYAGRIEEIRPFLKRTVQDMRRELAQLIAGEG